MPANKVSIGVELTGVQQARQEAGSLAEAIAAIYAGMNIPNGGASIAASKPAGSPAIVPGTSNGLGEYNTPINQPHSSSVGFGSLSGVLAPALSFSTSSNSSRMVTPPPDPMATGGNHLPPSGGGPGGPPSGGGSHNGPIDVRVVWSIPLNFANGGSGGAGNGSGSGGTGGGGNGGSGGGSGNGTGNGGGSGQNGSAPAAAPLLPPYSAGFNGFSPNANKWASTAMHYAQNPGALMDLVPAPLALAGLAVTTGFEAATANFAAYRPTYDLETSVQAATRSGQMFKPNLRAAQQKVATDQGDSAYYEAHRNTLYGWAGRIGSLGAADWYYNTHIKPGIDRRTKLDIASLQALPEGIRFQALTGQISATDDGTLDLRTQLTGMTGAFGGKALSTLQNSTAFNRLVSGGWSNGDVTNAYQGVLGVAGSQQNGALYGQISAGTDPGALGMASLPSLVAAGNTSGINQLRPLIGNAATDAAIMQARNTFALGVRSQIDQSVFSSAGSQVSLLGATGAGYRSISSAIGSEGSLLNPVRGDLQQKMALASAAGNTADAASIAAQIKSLDAQQAGLRQQAAMTVFTGRGVDNQTLSLGASNTMYGATYGAGTAGAVDSAFGSDRKAKQAQANLFRDMSRSPYISPEQRAVYAQQARQMEMQAGIGVDRDRSQFDYSITQGKIGISGAQAGFVQAGARLFGDSTANFNADMGMANITGNQARAVQSRLADTTAHLSPQERQDLERQQIDLTKQFNQALEEARRGFLSMRLSTDQAQASIVHMGNSMQMQFFGQGGSAAGILQSSDIGANRKSLRDAQLSFDYYDAQVKSGKLSVNAPDYTTAKQDMQQAQGKLYGSEDALATLPGSLASRNLLLDANFSMQVASKTFLPFGNVRGNIEAGMGAIGAQIKDLDRNEQVELMQAGLDKYSSDADKQNRLGQIRYNFKQQRYGLNGQLIDYQSQLQNGWQDRLISTTVNSPSRSAFAAAGFTMRESSNFLQNTDLYNGSFGFGGAGAKDARDSIIDRYSRYLSGATIGNISRPEGFMATAMSGVTHGGGGVLMRPSGAPAMSSGIAMMPTGVLQAPVQANVKLEITLVDQRVIVKAGNATASISLDKGGNSGVIHSIGSGAAEMVRSSHNFNGGSHQ